MGTTTASLGGRLRYVHAGEAGIERLGRTRFRYRDAASGRTINDDETLARIRALAIPPAWTNVWICSDPSGHIQATGRDARGRKQYRYHPTFRAARERAKFRDLVPFGESLDKLRARVDRDLDLAGMPFERVVALVIGLLEQTLVRVGNEEYAADNRTFGLTTLRNRHVSVRGSNLRLKFVAKGGRMHEVACDDKRLCRLVRRCQDLGGQTLFQYCDEDGAVRPVSSSDVNEYLRDATGIDVTAKTFRTWGATLGAASLLADLDPPETQRAAKEAVSFAVDQVAAELGNTPRVCRASYIHPIVIAEYERGTLPDRWSAGPSRPRGNLTTEERKLLYVLRGRMDISSAG